MLREQIHNSLEKAQRQKNTLKRNHARFTTANILLSAIASFLAGIAGTVGNAETWRPLCLVSAVCSASAAVTIKMQTAEQLTEASECVEQLRALKVELFQPMI
jgi:hypothetical protein